MRELRLLTGLSPQARLCPVSIRLIGDDVAVVHEPVDCGRGHRSVREDVVPVAKRLVVGHQQRLALIAVTDQLKQHRRLQLAAPHVGDVVNDQQGVANQTLQHCRQLAAGLGLLQQLHQRDGREKAAGLVLLHHRHRDRNGQVGLTWTQG